MADQSPTPMTKAVLDKIFTLYNKYPQIKIIVATGDNQHLRISNAQIMKNYLTRLGIPGNLIIEEDKSSNTYENIVNSVKIMKSYKLSKPAIVIYDLHLRRAQATAKKLGLKGAWITAITPRVAMGKRKFWQLNRFSMSLYEVGALVFSKLVGWA